MQRNSLAVAWFCIAAFLSCAGSAAKADPMVTNGAGSSNSQVPSICGTIAAAATDYCTAGTAGAAGTNQNFAMISPASGRLSNLYVRLATAPGVGQTVVA